MKGCIHIYCGDGKGKTSAALGLAVRAAGRGKKVLLVRFLKNDDSGELVVFKAIPQIDIFPCEKSFGFVFRMSGSEKKAAALFYRDYFARACREAAEKKYDIVIFDELMAANNYQMVPDTDILEFLKKRPAAMEVVMTGRQPGEALTAAADYVSEIKMIKHPFTKGLAAREGIEY